MTTLCHHTVDAHVGMVRGLIERLNLRNITIVVQDWGGPNGLINAAEMPDRFSRLIILNTWLHHDGYSYTQALLDWNARSQGVDFSKLGALPWGARQPRQCRHLDRRLPGALSTRHGRGTGRRTALAVDAAIQESQGRRGRTTGSRVCDPRSLEETGARDFR